ncbi:DUF2281 domain-containing protein [Nodosilinea sp. AN01ver1]|uniref:DUF2281 domain-containing protein n=1 Tax=Nodosilinea sp. AN01ver1 TaxID=3423362 RepID=UPI003D31E7DB
MSTAETIYEIVKALPEEKAHLVLVFTQFVQQQQKLVTYPIPKGTLTGLRGIAKPSGDLPSDKEITDNYMDYLIEKYQRRF